MKKFNIVNKAELLTESLIQAEKISYTFDTNILSMGGSFGSKGSKR